MKTREDPERAVLYRLLQTTYFDSIDTGDPKTAVTALTEDVVWTHTQVWEHDGHDRSATDTLHGRDEVYDLLAGRIDEMQEEGIIHEVREVIKDGDRGAFRAEVVGSGDVAPFLGWVELEDGKVSKYTVTPERIPE